MNMPSATAPPDSLSRVAGRALRIAIIAPPWIPIPPPAYGGIEAVVALLCDELVAKGHDVTLFAAPGSRSPARVHAPLGEAHPDRIGSALFEADHVGSAYDAIDRAASDGKPFDVVHDHSGFTAVAMANRVPAPVVHTLHGPFDEHTGPFYQRHGHKAHLVAISDAQREQAPPGVRVAEQVSNPIRLEDWPFQEDKDDYLLWMGRMDPVKGAHRAIRVARRCGRRLVLAGPVQPGQEGYFDKEVLPLLDGNQITFLGEVRGHRRQQLLGRASALLMPIRWPEPFGMVMVEALTCGTPVLAFPEGAAREIVIHGDNGFHVTDELEMAGAVAELHKLDPKRCRESVAERYEATVVADRYVAVYERAVLTAVKRTERLIRQPMLRPARPQGPERAHGAARESTLPTLSQG